MSLVAYDDSSSSNSSDNDSDDCHKLSAKPNSIHPAKKPKLVLPNLIKDLHFGDTSNQPDDNTDTDAKQQHNGRVRSFGHERGNWATYVFIDFPDPDGVIAKLQTAIQKHYSDDDEHTLDLQPTAHLHISLTRTVVLKHHWIELFVQSLRECIPKHSRFPIRLTGINIYCNDERTRTFIGLTIDDHRRATKHIAGATERIVRSLDTVLSEFRLPAFHAEGSYHVSILWCLGDQQKRLLGDADELLALMQRHIDDAGADANDDSDGSDPFALSVTHVDCKIGNKLYTFATS